MPDAPPPVTIATLPCTWPRSPSSESLVPGHVDFSRASVEEDPLNLINADAIQLGDLRGRHAIAGQSTHPTELRGWYLMGLAPFDPLPWGLDPRRGYLVPCGGPRHPRRASGNTRLSPPHQAPPAPSPTPPAALCH